MWTIFADLTKINMVLALFVLPLVPKGQLFSGRTGKGVGGFIINKVVLAKGRNFFSVTATMINIFRDVCIDILRF